MAGDWIKMRADLRTHPKVVRIVSALKADKLHVVGGLHAVWSLFDAHSIDGFLEGYTLEAIDSELGSPGFGAAMKAVGWLEETPEGLATPRFDEHNGQSAKRRATETQRKREERKVSASDADKTRSREEKRREDSSVPKGTGAAGAGKQLKTPEQRRKSELWAAIKTLLVESGESKDLKSAGAIVTSTITRYDEPTALAAIDATLHARPAGVIAYLEGACQQATGHRPNKQETLEAGNLAAAERFALGVANEIH
ncbi:hypothetical protein QTI05_22630 [Variovorax sp. J22R193]|uniref:hypothetical protein n=1 Tax=Variovorax fucosicus TaxID=3053517 RepID=UPI002578F846|nr:hypothetical protein [Variovorax sp. J22R193]MDM0041854.1 hypothetical protein [Variovorax sp. J22R193]